MKIDYKNDKFIVYFSKINNYSFDFKNREKLEEDFKRLFLKISELYNIDFCGSYNVEVFNDKYYGIILLIKEDECEYMDYYHDQIDMNININNRDGFLYKIIGNMYNRINNKCDLYLYNKEIYVNLKNDDDKILNYLIENCEIIYGNIVNEVILNGKLIKNDDFLLSI